MEIRISYAIGQSILSASAYSISEAYAIIKDIISKEPIMQKRTDETLSQYMEILVNMANGKTISHKNYCITIERV